MPQSVYLYGRQSAFYRTGPFIQETGGLGGRTAGVGTTVVGEDLLLCMIPDFPSISVGQVTAMQESVFQALTGTSFQSQLVTTGGMIILQREDMAIVNRIGDSISQGVLPELRARGEL